VRTVRQYAVAHRIRFLGQVDFRAAYEALIKGHRGLAMQLRQRGMVATEHVQDPGVTVAVTFSQVGQPQAITAPASYTTVGGKG
jgi:hypothetical protein